MEEWQLYRYDIINRLIKKYNYKKYLEIGIHIGTTFECIDIQFKEGVDPNSPYADVKYRMTSDEFFKDVAPTLDYKYDIIFIDGLHEFPQVNKDVENSLKYLSENGTIVMHDCNPTEEVAQIVPQVFFKYWNGDVWKTILKLRIENPNLTIDVVDTDCGCGILQRGQQVLYTIPDTYTNSPYEYKHLEENRTEILNLISIEKFHEKYKLPKKDINYIKLKSIVDTSCYATAGMVASEKDIELAESYILYNKEFIDKFPYVITSNNKLSVNTDDSLLAKYNSLWKDYFGDRVINLPAKENRGHTFGTMDIENAIFEYTKLHKDKIKWVWKFSFDIICNIEILEREVEEADFYYINNIGYKYLADNKFDINECIRKIISKEYMYPQTPYYIIKNDIDELNDSIKYNTYYEQFIKRTDKNIKPWELMPGCDCESFLNDCVIRNNYTSYNLLYDSEYKDLLNNVLKYKMVDGSLKNIMFSGLGNLCHFQYPENEVIIIN